MKDIKIVFLLNPIYKKKDYDYLGNEIPIERASRYSLIIPISFFIDNYKLDSLLVVSIPKKNLPPNQHKQFTISLAIELFPQDIKTLNDINVFPICYYPMIRDKYEIKEFEKHKYEIEVATVVSDGLFNSLIKQREKDRLAKDAFNSTTKVLLSFAYKFNSYQFEHYASDIKGLLSYLECCFHNSEYLILTEWYREKLPILRSSFKELINRKIENSTTYKSLLDNLQTIISRLKPPHSWYEEPPNPNNYNVDEIIKKHLLDNEE